MWPPDFETEFTDEIVCPYCAYVHRDSWEVDFGPGFEGDLDSFMCWECDKEFSVSRNVQVTYSSRKKKDADKE